jgi:hypothetical protein
MYPSVRINEAARFWQPKKKTYPKTYPFSTSFYGKLHQAQLTVHTCVDSKQVNKGVEPTGRLIEIQVTHAQQII